MNSIALPKRKDFAAYRATWVFAAALCLLILQALQATAQMLPNTFADLADEISPSVVNITTTTVIAGRADQMPRGIVPRARLLKSSFGSSKIVAVAAMVGPAAPLPWGRGL